MGLARQLGVNVEHPTTSLDLQASVADRVAARLAAI
jgi:hypothetical protein